MCSNRIDRVGAGCVDQVRKTDTEDFIVPVVICENQTATSRSTSGSVDVATAQLVFERIKGRFKVIGKFIEDVGDLAGIGMVI